MAILDITDVLLKTPIWFRSFFEETTPLVLRSTVHPYLYCHDEYLYGEVLIDIRGRGDIHHLPPIFDADCQTPPPPETKATSQCTSEARFPPTVYPNFNSIADAVIVRGSRSSSSNVGGIESASIGHGRPASIPRRLHHFFISSSPVKVCMNF
jgi:hypothetical protein